MAEQPGSGAPDQPDEVPAWARSGEPAAAPSRPGPVRAAEGGPPRHRLAAAVLDNVVLPVGCLGTGSLVSRGLPGIVVATLLLVGLTVVAEGLTGRTPGKAIIGLRTRRTGGADLDLPTALARRPWPMLLGMGQVVPVSLGLAVLLMGVVAISIRVSGADRGLHDRLADTEVVDAPVDTATRRLGALAVLGPLSLTLVRLAFP